MKDENMTKIIKIIENNYNYIHNEIEILLNVDEIVNKSRANEMEYFQYDKEYTEVMKKRNELESLVYIYMFVIILNYIIILIII